MRSAAATPRAARGAVRLRPGVVPVERTGGLLLVSPEDVAVRVGAAALDLVPLIREGTSFERLAALLRTRHPAAGDVDAQLAVFLGQLWHAGLLEGAPGARARRSSARRFRLVDPDPLARRIAAAVGLLPAPVRRVALAASIAAAAAALGWVASSGQRPRVSDVAHRFDPYALALFVLVVIPLHELAHAVAARRTGVAVTDIGVLLWKRVFPTPYSDTSGAYRVSGRSARALIAFAGPLVDLWSAGVAAAVAVTAAGEPAHAALYLVVLCGLAVCFDVNPMFPSDGSRVLEALAGDELLRQRALAPRAAGRARPAAVRAYRAAALFWIAATAATGVWLSVGF